jgi:hypothetical protein
MTEPFPDQLLPNKNVGLAEGKTMAAGLFPGFKVCPKYARFAARYGFWSAKNPVRFKSRPGWSGVGK